MLKYAQDKRRRHRLTISLLALVSILWLLGLRWSFGIAFLFRPYPPDSPPTWAAARTYLPRMLAYEISIRDGILYFSPDVPKGDVDHFWFHESWWGIRRELDTPMRDRLGLVLPQNARLVRLIGGLRPLPWIRFALPLWIPWLLLALSTTWFSLRHRKALPPREARHPVIAPRMSWPVALMLSIGVGVALFLAIPIVVETLLMALFDLDYITDSRIPSPVMYAILIVLYIVTPYIGARFSFKKIRWRRVWETAPHCEQCGYNLTGNVSGVCSECGTPCRVEEVQSE